MIRITSNSLHNTKNNSASFVPPDTGFKSCKPQVSFMSQQARSKNSSASFVPPDTGAMTVGNFDGVHLGHKELIETTVRYAQQVRKPSLLYTFYPHPALFLYPKKKHRLLCSFQQSQERLRGFHLDHIIVQPFTKAFASLSPEEFIEKHILARFRPEWILVGSNFRFGKERAGSIAFLKKLAKKGLFKLKVIASLKKAGRVVSTSAIKELVSLGQWNQVRALLGRPFSLKGMVVKGHGRGQKLGVPTINIELEKNIILPPLGVYAGWLREGNKNWPAVLNLGYNPTFSQKKLLKAEVHIIGFKKSWRSKMCEVEIVRFIRPEKKFPHQSALIHQIQEDIKQASSIKFL